MGAVASGHLEILQVVLEIKRSIPVEGIRKAQSASNRNPPLRIPVDLSLSAEMQIKPSRCVSTLFPLTLFAGCVIVQVAKRVFADGAISFVVSLLSLPDRDGTEELPMWAGQKIRGMPDTRPQASKRPKTSKYSYFVCTRHALDMHAAHLRSVVSTLRGGILAALALVLHWLRCWLQDRRSSMALVLVSSEP